MEGRTEQGESVQLWPAIEGKTCLRFTKLISTGRGIRIDSGQYRGVKKGRSSS